MDVWPRWSSDSVDWLLRQLFRSPAPDVGSGYRVSRALALQQLRFENDGYAFQWEIVLLALAKRIARYRSPGHPHQGRRGKSKLYLVETGRSYLQLFTSHPFRGIWR
jgi:hypothetical protein